MNYLPTDQLESAEVPSRFMRLAAAGMAAGILLLPACASSHHAPERPPAVTAIEADGRGIILESLGPEDDIYTSDLYIDLPTFGIVDPDAVTYQEVKWQGGTRHYLPLATISLTENVIGLRDKSPDGMDKDTMQWIGDRVMAHEPLVREALKSGSVKSIIFALGHDLNDEASGSDDSVPDLHPYFNNLDKTVVLELSPYASSIPKEMMEQDIVHEITHSLFADVSVSTFSEVKANPELVKQFKKACFAIRSQALEDIKYDTAEIANALEDYIRYETNPAGRRRYQALLEAINSGAWVALEPTTAKPQDREEKIQECATVHLGVMARVIAEQRQLPAVNSHGVRPHEEELGEAYNHAQNALDDLFRKSSLYRVLTEGSYADDDLMGHPHDDLDELVASLTNVTISYPEEMAQSILSLNDEQKQAVLQMVHLVFDQLSKAHPNLKTYLSGVESNLLKLVN